MNITVANIEKQMSDKLVADNSREILAHYLHIAAAGLIGSKWNGKKLNQRFITDFKAVYFTNDSDRERSVVVLEYIAGMCYLCIWGIDGAPTSEQRVRLFLGYADMVFRGNGDENRSRSYNFLTPAGFEENDRSNGSAAAERIASRCRVLGDVEGKLTRLATAIAAQKKAQAEVSTLLEDPDFSSAGPIPNGLL